MRRTGYVLWRTLVLKLEMVVSLILQALFPVKVRIKEQMFDGILGRNSENKTPLHLAVEYDHLKYVMIIHCTLQ